VWDRRFNHLVSGDTGYPLGVCICVFEDVWPEPDGSAVQQASWKIGDDEYAFRFQCNLYILTCFRFLLYGEIVSKDQSMKETDLDV
jgi:hypothetical protein